MRAAVRHHHMLGLDVRVLRVHVLRQRLTQRQQTLRVAVVVHVCVVGV